MLIKGGVVIESLAKAEVVAFDKTGTLTQGKPQVTEVLTGQGTVVDLLSTAVAIKRESGHPLAEAICRHAAGLGIAAKPAEDVRNIAGRGMEGKVEGRAVFIGAPRFAAPYGSLRPDQVRAVARLEGEGKTLAVVMADGRRLA